MAYTRVNWQNSPSHATPLSAENLNVMDAAIEELDGAVTEATGDIADLETTVSGHTTSITGLQTTVGEHTTDISNIEDDVSGLQTTVSGHTTSIGNLANLNTTEKSNLVGAINEVNEDVSDVKEDSKYTKTALLDTNCAEMVSLLNLKPKTTAGVTYTPTDNGRVITATGTPTGTYQYYLVDGNIDNYPFEPGGKYRIAYNGVAGAYLQVISNQTSVVLNTGSFDGIKEITIPSNCTELWIRIYCGRTVPTGTHRVSIINTREMDYLEDVNFSERPTIEELKTIIGFNKPNLFENIETVSGYYVNLNTGKLGVLSSYSATDYFPVISGATYDLPCHSSGSQIAFYDSDKEYVSGFLTTSDTFAVPDNDNIAYGRWCGETSSINSWALYLEPLTEEKVKYITTTEGILAGVIDAYSKGIKKIIVQSGAYDIMAEYESYYGASYFSGYADNYNGQVNGKFDCGIWLDNIDISFESGVIVNANYTGNNQYVKSYFSAFAIGQNVTLDGLVLDASELRYGLHPDFHAKQTEKLTIKNCDLHHYKSSDPDVNNNQAVGAGLGVYSIWEIENCIFRSDTSNPVLRIHNNASENAMSKILIKDCYIVGNGYILLNSYSTSTKQTNALVVGCSWEKPAVVGKETSASNDNITMYAWNNELRS